MADIDLYKKAINTFGESAQMIVALEECSELQKEITKLLRGQGNLEHLAEEMADAEIMLEQLKLIFGLHSQVTKVKGEKIARLKRVIDSFEGVKPDIIKSKKRNIDKIQSMDADAWGKEATVSPHIVPSLCFMCVGCEECNENCGQGVKEYLEKEVVEC